LAAALGTGYASVELHRFGASEPPSHSALLLSMLMPSVLRFVALLWLPGPCHPHTLALGALAALLALPAALVFAMYAVRHVRVALVAASKLHRQHREASAGGGVAAMGAGGSAGVGGGGGASSSGSGGGAAAQAAAAAALEEKKSSVLGALLGALFGASASVLLCCAVQLRFLLPLLTPATGEGGSWTGSAGSVSGSGGDALEGLSSDDVAIGGADVSAMAGGAFLFGAPFALLRAQPLPGCPRAAAAPVSTLHGMVWQLMSQAEAVTTVGALCLGGILFAAARLTWRTHANTPVHDRSFSLAVYSIALLGPAALFPMGLMVAPEDTLLFALLAAAASTGSIGAIFLAADGVLQSQPNVQLAWLSVASGVFVLLSRLLEGGLYGGGLVRLWPFSAPPWAAADAATLAARAATSAATGSVLGSSSAAPDWWPLLEARPYFARRPETDAFAAALPAAISLITEGGASSSSSAGLGERATDWRDGWEMWARSPRLQVWRVLCFAPVLLRALLLIGLLPSLVETDAEGLSTGAVLPSQPHWAVLLPPALSLAALVLVAIGLRSDTPHARTRKWTALAYLMTPSNAWGELFYRPHLPIGALLLAAVAPMSMPAALGVYARIARAAGMVQLSERLLAGKGMAGGAADRGGGGGRDKHARRDRDRVGGRRASEDEEPPATTSSSKTKASVATPAHKPSAVQPSSAAAAPSAPSPPSPPTAGAAAAAGAAAGAAAAGKKKKGGKEVAATADAASVPTATISPPEVAAPKAAAKPAASASASASQGLLPKAAAVHPNVAAAARSDAILGSTDPFGSDVKAAAPTEPETTASRPATVGEAVAEDGEVSTSTAVLPAAQLPAVPVAAGAIPIPPALAPSAAEASPDTARIDPLELTEEEAAEQAAAEAWLAEADAEAEAWLSTASAEPSSATSVPTMDLAAAAAAAAAKDRAEATARAAAEATAASLRAADEALQRATMAKTSSNASSHTATALALGGLKRGEEDEPADYLCPITHDVMVDPVVTADGQSYERVAIEQWLLHSAMSPLTGEPLAHLALTPNMALRRLIQEWMSQRPPPGAPSRGGRAGRGNNRSGGRGRSNSRGGSGRQGGGRGR
jgi:hypothetical protein